MEGHGKSNIVPLFQWGAITIKIHSISDMVFVKPMHHFLLKLLSNMKFTYSC